MIAVLTQFFWTLAADDPLIGLCLGIAVHIIATAGKPA
jgi:hypothetical protein